MTCAAQVATSMVTNLLQLSGIDNMMISHKKHNVYSLLTTVVKRAAEEPTESLRRIFDRQTQSYGSTAAATVAFKVSVQLHWATSNVCNSDSDQVSRYCCECF